MTRLNTPPISSLLLISVPGWTLCINRQVFNMCCVWVGSSNHRAEIKLPLHRLTEFRGGELTSMTAVRLEPPPSRYWGDCMSGGLNHCAMLPVPMIFKYSRVKLYRKLWVLYESYFIGYLEFIDSKYLIRHVQCHCYPFFQTGDSFPANLFSLASPSLY